jgi:two-component system, OmpR family, sensor kinase
LISDLLDSARLEEGLFSIERRATELVNLARDVAAELSPTPDRVKVTACVKEVWAEADPERLRQALENLVSNALKFAPDSTPVTVQLNTEERGGATWGLITVADRGPGIPRELQKRLFERFARGPGSQGLGLGLYLAHRVAEAHGGVLTVDSAPEIGARFTLAVPADCRLNLESA